MHRGFYSVVVASLFFVVYLLTAQKVWAAQLTSASDTISTSRPSASAVLNTDQAANATTISVIDLGSSNGLMYIASDSATFWAGTGETADYNIKYVASSSAQIAGTPNTRNIYFTGSNTIPHAHHKGDAVSVPITAMHKIVFTTATTLPSGGKILITFPTLSSGDANSAASPSASTFQLNGLSDTNIKAFSGSSALTFTGSYTNPSSGTSPVITLGSLGSSITAGTTVTIYVGCSAAAAVAKCDTQVPTIINPTKNAATGTADSWRVQIDTQDGSSNPYDTGKVKIDTIEAVQVYATVEPSLTFTIAGENSGTDYHTISTSCASETSNTGINSTPTIVNLGTLTNGTTSHIGQTLTISTNGASGYALTATSSGRLIDVATGFWIPDANGGTGLTANDTPIPAAMTTGTAAFGVSPCGAHVPTSTPNWGGTSGVINSGGTSTALFSNPWNTSGNGYYATLASYTGGPISGDITVMRYAGTVAGTTPPGIYSTVLTYVATATF